MRKILSVLLIILAVAFILFGIKRTIFLQQSQTLNHLSMEYLMSREYSGSDIAIEQTLPSGSNYKIYIASYLSDGLKIYALLTVPESKKTDKGFPAIVFNHGYIIPEKYTPDGNYIPYVDALSKAGYVVFKPDYRGHGNSEGFPTSEYFSQDYAIDDLNAIASIQKFNLVDKDKIGVWGHSLGGNIALKDLVVSKKIKAVVIWSGVVGTIEDITFNWQTKVSYKPAPEDLLLRYKGFPTLLAEYGPPSEKSEFWKSIDPINYLNKENIPVQIHVGLSDTQVPPDFSKNLYLKLKSLNKPQEYYEYPGANHDINQSFNSAMQKTIDFYNRYLKQTP